MWQISEYIRRGKVIRIIEEPCSAGICERDKDKMQRKWQIVMLLRMVMMQEWMKR